MIVTIINNKIHIYNKNMTKLIIIRINNSIKIIKLIHKLTIAINNSKIQIKTTYNNRLIHIIHLISNNKILIINIATEII